MIRPTWKHPRPYGTPAATDSASTIAAPLLAGFSITLIAQVIDSRDSVRWPDVVFILLAGASVAMLTAVQSGFWARQYYVRPEELEDWWPDIGHPRRWENVRQDQWAHARVHERWCIRFRRAYRFGILLLLAGLGFALVPSATGGDFGWPRALAIGVVGAGFLGELLWIGASRMLHFEAALELRRDRRTAETRRDELAERPDDPQAMQQLALLTRRLADRPGKELAEARERLAAKRKELTEELPRGVRGVVRLALRIANAIVPPVLLVEPPKEVPPPAAQRALVHDEAAPTVRAARLGSRQVEVLAFVAHSTGVSSDEVAKATGLPPARAGEILASLTERGELRHFERNGRVSYRLPGS